MLAAVTEADVVLVNPTHVAVALQYRRTWVHPGWWPRAPTPWP
jgi:flagellar biosynthesis protein FlhB